MGTNTLKNRNMELDHINDSISFRKSKLNCKVGVKTVCYFTHFIKSKTDFQVGLRGTYNLNIAFLISNNEADLLLAVSDSGVLCLFLTLLNVQ